MHLKLTKNSQTRTERRLQNVESVIATFYLLVGPMSRATLSILKLHTQRQSLIWRVGTRVHMFIQHMWTMVSPQGLLGEPCILGQNNWSCGSKNKYKDMNDDVIRWKKHWFGHTSALLTTLSTLPPPSDTAEEEKGESVVAEPLFLPPSLLPCPPLYVAAASPQKREALQWHSLTPTGPLPLRQQQHQERPAVSSSPDRR